jgi:hypothetical protein
MAPPEFDAVDRYLRDAGTIDIATNLRDSGTSPKALIDRSAV